MINVDLLNGWASVWAGFMVRALIDSTLLLCVVLAIWLPLRKRMSVQLAHGLFCLVLLKLIVPIPVTWPGWMPTFSVRQAAEHVSDWARIAEPEPEQPLVASAPALAPLVLPTTGDLGSSFADPVPSAPEAASAAEPVATRVGPVEGEPIRTVAAARSPEPVMLSAAAILMIGWALFSLFLLGRLARAVISTRRLIRDAVPLGEDWLPIDLDALRKTVGIRVPVRWAVSPKLHSPAVGGLLRPTVVIPPDLDDGLTPKQLTWVLLHELAHVRRGDLWVTIMQRIEQALFFFHPAVHVANWVIDQLREYACDDVALAASKSSRHDCGEGFLTVVGRTVDRAPMPVPALGLFESRMLIRRRLLRILDKRRKVHERLSARACVGLLALGVLVLPHGKAQDASARIASKLDVAAQNDNMLAGDPASYRPGAVWKRSAPSESTTAPTSTGSRVVGLSMSLAYSPDGSLLASAGEDASVLVRESASGKVIHRLDGHRDSVTCLAFSADGRTLATGGYDRTVRLWDVGSGLEIRKLEGHGNWVFAVAFAPDGKTLASAGHDRSVRLWDASTGRQLALLSGHSSSVRALAFSPRGSVLATAGADRAVILWDLRTEKPRTRLDGHRGTIRSLAFTSDGRTLATGSEDGEARLWDVATGAARATLAGHTDMVICLAFSPRNETLATGSLDATVKLWDVKSGHERASLTGRREGVSSVAFAPGARQLATGGFDGSVQIWEPTAPIFTPAACLEYSGEALAVAFAPDARSLIAAGKTGVARWDARTGSALGTPRTGDETALAIAPNGNLYAVGNPDGKIRLVELASAKTIATFAAHQGPVTSLAFAADSRLLVSGGNDGVVQRWDVEKRRALGALAKQGESVTSVAFSPDRRTLAVSVASGGVGRSSGAVVFWDAATWTVRGILPSTVSRIESVNFSPDGRLIAVASADGLVQLRDANSGAPQRSLTHDKCRTATFSPDGRVLATANARGETLLWDVDSGQQVGMLKGHRGTVHQLAFAPDGSSLASAGADGWVKIWTLAARRQTARASLKGDLNILWSVAYSPDGKTLAVADAVDDTPGNVTLWDVASRRIKATLEGHEKGIASVVFSPDGKTLASGGDDGTIRLWDAATGESRYVLTGIHGVSELAFSPDGKLLASAGEGKSVTLWDVETGAEVDRLADFSGPVIAIAFSPDGRFLATGGGIFDRSKPRGEVKVWDVAKRSVVWTLDGHTCGVLTLAFSPDGTTLASGGLDQTIRLWDLDSGVSRLAVSGLPSCVRSLAFSKDSRLLGWSGRGDGLVPLLDARTGAEVVRLVGHGNTVLSIAFSPDGSGLATAGADRTIKLWDVPSQGASLTAKR